MMAVMRIVRMMEGWEITLKVWRLFFFCLSPIVISVEASFCLLGQSRLSVRLCAHACVRVLLWFWEYIVDAGLQWPCFFYDGRIFHVKYRFSLLLLKLVLGLVYAFSRWGKRVGGEGMCCEMYGCVWENRMDVAHSFSLCFAVCHCVGSAVPYKAPSKTDIRGLSMQETFCCTERYNYTTLEIIRGCTPTQTSVAAR